MSSELSVSDRPECILWSDHSQTMGTTIQQISVILPVYSEEISVGSVIHHTKLYADKVIVVDDSIWNCTADIARKAGAEVIVHEINKGRRIALKTGFETAVILDADIIMTMSSDSQHNPAEIPKLVAPIVEGKAEMINGSRYLDSQKKNTPAYHCAGQTSLDRFTNVDSGLRITDSQSGFRVFATSAIEDFLFNVQGMALESEMLTDAGNSGLWVKEVPIGVRYDFDGSTEKQVYRGLEIL
jgi:glycosyltransferase involved in cell wall biosynthesis